MNANEAADILEEQGRTEAARILRETAGRIQADAQALADVQTLDDWAERHPQFPFILQRGEAEETDRWCCWREGRISERCYFYGATPEEARAAAAAWVREQKNQGGERWP